jgi:Na+-transporting methylmalonyl-CoA/oxaloacetate decarboxylase gamma subunit
MPNRAFVEPPSAPDPAPPKLHNFTEQESSSEGSDLKGSSEACKDVAVTKLSKRSVAETEVSLFAKIAAHEYFQNTTMAVIVANAVWIGIDVNLNHDNLKKDGKKPLTWAPIVENLFCVYFSVELLIRFVAFPVKRQCIFDAWFVFDGILVACMVLETWLMPLIGLLAGGSGEGGGLAALSPFRLLRLLRLTRMARLMKFLPQMLTLVKGIFAAARSVGFIFLFLVMVIYVFGILFTSQLEDRKKHPLTPYCEDEKAAGLDESDGCLKPSEFGETAQDMFASLGDSMMTLFTRGVLGDNLAETVQAILDCGGDDKHKKMFTKGFMLMWAFWIFFIITFATLLNMLIGVLCEVINSVAEEEDERAMVEGLEKNLGHAFSEVDENHDGIVTEVEWNHMTSHPEVAKNMGEIFEDDDMDMRLDQLHNLFFERDEDDPGTQAREDDGLKLNHVIEHVIAMRPTCHASALEMEMLANNVATDQDLMCTQLQSIEERLRKVLGEAAAARCPYQAVNKKGRSSQILAERLSQQSRPKSR